ncbi:hypothetical protein EDB85DRAFT_2277895, partial [Lactarius pseudohatsudake]
MPPLVSARPPVHAPPLCAPFARNRLRKNGCATGRRSRGAPALGLSAAPALRSAQRRARRGVTPRSPLPIPHPVRSRVAPAQGCEGGRRSGFARPFPVWLPVRAPTEAWGAKEEGGLVPHGTGGAGKGGGVVPRGVNGGPYLSRPRPLCAKMGVGAKGVVRAPSRFRANRGGGAWPHVCMHPLRANQGRGVAAPLPGWLAAYRSRVAFVREREWRRKGEALREAPTGGAAYKAGVGGRGARGNGGGGSCELSRHSTEGAKRRAHGNRGGAFCGHSQGGVTTGGALTFGRGRRMCIRAPFGAKGGGDRARKRWEEGGGGKRVLFVTSPTHRIRYTGRVVYALFTSISFSMYLPVKKNSNKAEFKIENGESGPDRG